VFSVLQYRSTVAKDVSNTYRALASSSSHQSTSFHASSLKTYPHGHHSFDRRRGFDLALRIGRRCGVYLLYIVYPLYFLKADTGQTPILPRASCQLQPVWSAESKSEHVRRQRACRHLPHIQCPRVCTCEEGPKMTTVWKWPYMMRRRVGKAGH
jgi:hypothetical protein